MDKSKDTRNGTVDVSEPRANLPFSLAGKTNFEPGPAAGMHALLEKLLR